jgi:hypothetical protein
MLGAEPSSLFELASVLVTTRPGCMRGKPPTFLGGRASTHLKCVRLTAGLRMALLIALDKFVQIRREP